MAEQVDPTHFIEMLAPLISEVTATKLLFANRLMPRLALWRSCIKGESPCSPTPAVQSVR